MKTLMRDPNLSFVKSCLRTKEFDSSFYKMLKHEILYLKESGQLIGKWHPLGFIILTLQDWHNDERVRIHIWPSKPSKYRDRNWIHNHDYNITSLVLLGTIVNYKYAILPNDCDGKLPIYHVDRTGENSDLIKTDSYCDVALESSEVIEEGQSYNIDKADFHVSDVAFQTVTSTIVLNSERETSSPLILGDERNDDDAFIFTRNECDDQKFEHMIDALLFKLSELSLVPC